MIHRKRSVSQALLCMVFLIGACHESAPTRKAAVVHPPGPTSIATYEEAKSQVSSTLAVAEETPTSITAHNLVLAMQEARALGYYLELLRSDPSLETRAKRAIINAPGASALPLARIFHFSGYHAGIEELFLHHKKQLCSLCRVATRQIWNLLRESQAQGRFDQRTIAAIRTTKGVPASVPLQDIRARARAAWPNGSKVYESEPGLADAQILISQASIAAVLTTLESVLQEAQSVDVASNAKLQAFFRDLQAEPSLRPSERTPVLAAHLLYRLSIHADVIGYPVHDLFDPVENLVERFQSPNLLRAYAQLAFASRNLQAMQAAASTAMRRTAKKNAELRPGDLFTVYELDFFRDRLDLLQHDGFVTRKSHEVLRDLLWMTLPTIVTDNPAHVPFHLQRGNEALARHGLQPVEWKRPR